MAAEVRRKLREREQGADRKLLTAEIAKTEREVQNAVDALVSLGKSPPCWHVSANWKRGRRR